MENKAEKMDSEDEFDRMLMNIKTEPKEKKLRFNLSIKQIETLRKGVMDLFLTNEDEEEEEKYSYFVRQNEAHNQYQVIFYSVYTTYKKALCASFFALLDNIMGLYSKKIVNEAKFSGVYKKFIKEREEVLFCIQNMNVDNFYRKKFAVVRTSYPHVTITKMCINVLHVGKHNDYRKKEEQESKVFSSFGELYDEFVRLIKIREEYIKQNNIVTKIGKTLENLFSPK
jgi:hypothetical protein